MFKKVLTVLLLSIFAVSFFSEDTFADGSEKVVNATELPVYQTYANLTGAAAQTKVATLTYGQRVTVGEYNLYAARIYYVSTDGTTKEGWVQKDYLSNNVTDIAWLVKETRTLRDGPSSDNKALGDVLGGSKVYVLEHKITPGQTYNDWYRVRTDDKREGWIWGSLYVEGSANKGANLIKFQFEKVRTVTNQVEIFSPLDTIANVTAGEINRYIDSKNKANSLMAGMGAAYIEAQNTTGLNAVYLLAHSGHETGWGTSAIVKNKYNYYGIGAIDSAPAEGAYTYDSPAGGVIAGAHWINRSYIVRDGNKYPLFQNTLDNMRFDNNGWHQYATDQAWAAKIGNYALEFYNFTYPNGFYLKTGWVKEGDNWYYFDSNGRMTTGWQTINGANYFMLNNGYMATGWTKNAGSWYYTNKDGATVTGWLYDKDVWYYLDGQGKMVTGWVYSGGSWYYMKNDGSMATGWVLDNGTWYYMNPDGLMKTGWLLDRGTWYYLSSSGAMLKGWMYDGSWYFMNNDGAMTTGWIQDRGTWYYMGSGGQMKTGWLYEYGTWYFLNSSGAMQTGWAYIGGEWYFLNNSGGMVSGWFNTGGAWYFLNNSGSMATGWRLVNGYWYYFYSNGAMAANTTIGGYRLDSGGAWVK